MATSKDPKSLRSFKSEINSNYRNESTRYQVNIKMTNELDLKQLLIDEKERGKIIQIINIKVKEKL